ncbi:MAG: MBL fold metallo-hydrolase [Armatimonadota bacterium]
MLTGCQPRLVSSPALQPPPKGTLQITFFDVGQGDAALIQFPNGKTMLVDGGPPESAAVLMGKLRQLKVARIDYLVASHPHSDHIGGFVKILNTLSVGEVWDTGFVYDSPIYLDYLRTIKRRGIKFRTVGRGYSLNPAPNCQIEVFAPSQPFLRGTRSDANNASLVMRLRCGKVRVLFTGDIEREGRTRLYRQGADLRAEVLKVSHHGSYNGTDMALLNRVRPRIAIISCGFRNLYGHPHREALQALQRAGVTVYRTDLHGDITVRVQSDRLQVFTTRKGTPAPTPIASAGKAAFIGNRKTQVYHAPDCARLPKPENRVYFQSLEEAERAGYRPHKECVEN